MIPNEYKTPADMPEPVRRLHKRIQQAAQQDRLANVPGSEQDVDENGRRWPGLHKPRRHRRRISTQGSTTP